MFLGAYGKTLTQLERYADAEAERTLLEAHELLAVRFGANHKRTTKTVNQLITLYDAWHAAEPNKGYDKKAAEWRAKLPEEPKPENP